MHPQYTQLTLNGYALADKFFNPHISVYPIQEYASLYPENIPPAVAALQALIGGGASSDAYLPFLPVFPAAQVFHAQYRVLPFMNGCGIRYLTLYAQYFAPSTTMTCFTPTRVSPATGNIGYQPSFRSTTRFCLPILITHLVA